MSVRASRARDDVALARIALGAIALHVADDAFFEPNPGTSAVDHVTPGLTSLVLVLAAAALFDRVRPGIRATIALLGGFFGLLVATEAVHASTSVGASGDDFTGLAAIPAGLLLLALGGRTLWISRRRGGRARWRYGRRLLLSAGAFVGALLVLFPVAVAYVVTHTARTQVPRADLGAPYRNVAFKTSDGLVLKGWYIASRNGAAVVSIPGRGSSQKRAKLLARHGYGVLVYDRRGEGESEGDPNAFGWHGERDVDAAVAYLRTRPDVDAHRIGGIGLSVGGEMLIAAAAHSNGLRAIVTEGASGRSVRDDLANPDRAWGEIIGTTIASAATAAFTGQMPPTDLRRLVPSISAATFFIYGARGQPAEGPANKAFYAAARGPKHLWQVPGAGHIGGTEARPLEYEQRVVAFFDRELLGH